MQPIVITRRAVAMNRHVHLLRLTLITFVALPLPGQRKDTSAAPVSRFLAMIAIPHILIEANRYVQ